MKTLLQFTKRNTKLFLRDRSTVFSSILSSLIIILLYFLFIAQMYIDGINENVATITKNQAAFIVYLQMMAGVLILNSMSLSLGMFTNMAKDFETQKINSFLITPIKKYQMIISYFLGGVVVSFILNLFTWIITILLIGIITGYWLTLSTLLLAIIILLIASLVSSSIMMLLTVVAKSSSALGVISGVGGTFLGFICGIYMPYSNLGKEVEAVGSLIPFTHLTIWFKNIVLNDAFAQIGIEGEAKEVLMRDWFSASGIGFMGINAPLVLMLIISSIFALLCLVISSLLLKKRIGTK